MLLLISANLRGGSGTSYTLTGLAGSYALSGGTAVLKVARQVTANAGTYALTGGTASLKVGRKITASAGSYSLSGGSAVVTVQRKITANAGSYSLTGGSATLTKTAGAIAYALSGNAGSYSLTGGNAGLVVGRSIVGNAGSYQLTGGDAVLTKTTGATSYTLTASAGAYALIGGDAVLSWSGASASVGRHRKKKQHYAEIDGKLFAFDTQSEAVRAVMKSQGASEAKSQHVAETTNEAVVELSVVREYASVTGKIEQYNEAYNSEHYEAIIALFEQMQDDEDIEVLLLAL